MDKSKTTSVFKQNPGTYTRQSHTSPFREPISFKIIINAENEIFKTALIYIDMKKLERIEINQKKKN